MDREKYLTFLWTRLNKMIREGVSKDKIERQRKSIDRFTSDNQVYHTGRV